MKKHSSTYLCLSAFLLLLAACGQDENLPPKAENPEIVAVDCTVTGIADYGEQEPVAGRTLPSSSTVAIPIDDDYEMEATFTPDAPVRGHSASARVALGNDICYRVLAYKDGIYRGFADYKIIDGNSSLIGGGLKLETGSYKFVAYSYNTSAPIIEEATTTEGITVNVDHDFLYWEEENKSIENTTSLSISFKHLFTQMKVIFDATEMGSNFNAASATLNAQSGLLYKSGTWTIGGTGIAASAESSYEPSFTFSTSGSTSITSNPLILLPIALSQALKLTVSAEFANGSKVAGKDLNLNSQAFNPNYSYTCTVKFKSSGVSMDDVTGGNDYGGGNCWVIPKADKEVKYSFDASKEGQSVDVVGTTVADGGTIPTAVSAKIVWKVGTDGKENNESLINSVSYNASTKKMTFTVGANQVGNAIIAVKDGGETILWSWHIWVVSDNSFISTGKQGDLMDRNLGAMSGAKEDGAATYGLFYQWGRKDPIRRENGNGADGPVALIESVKQPDKIIKARNAKVRNWCTSSDEFWHEAPLTVNMQKYNPCPKGWIVVPKMIYYNYGGSGELWNSVKDRFPAAGSRGGAAGSQSSVGENGNYWSATQNSDDDGYFLYFNYAGVSAGGAARAGGYSVRCVRE